MTTATAYVHNMDPYLIQFWGTWGIRWYGLAYLAGAIVGIVFLRWLAARGYGQLRKEEVTDFVIYTSIFGVMLGGRLGYMLLYVREDFLQNPLLFFRFTEGGMASHGGIFGIFLFTMYYAWRHQKNWPALGDNLVVIAPIGIFFGRLANFINGELYGRKTDVPWAVQFPEELKYLPNANAIIQQVNEVAGTSLRHVNEVIAAARERPEITEVLARHLTPRHPSQLYEAVLEGLLLTAILLPIRLRWKQLPFGLLTGLFFVLYAAFRMVGEQFREPDADLIMGLTRGQFYSIFMIVVGVGFILYSVTHKADRAGVESRRERKLEGDRKFDFEQERENEGNS